MRAALCLSGQMRTYKKCYGYIKQHIISKIDPDIFVYTEQNRGITNRLDVRDKREEERKVARESIRSIYEPEKIVIDAPFGMERKKSFKDVEVPEELIKKEPDHWKGNIPNFYGIKKCNDMKREKEKREGFEYDVVIRCRPDLIVESPIPEKVLKETGKLWHNHKNHPVQVSDKIAISSSTNMDYYSSVWNELTEYWKNPTGDGDWKNVKVGERLLRIHMEKSNIEVKSCNIKHRILRSRYFMKNKMQQRYKRKMEQVLSSPKEIAKRAFKMVYE